MTDWRAILKRYMQAVMENEGVSFVEDTEGLSDEQAAALGEAYKEVISEQDEYKMTGSSHPDIDALVTDWNTSKQARAVAAVQGDAALLAQVKDEIARLEATGGARNLLEQDEASRQVHRVLKALLAAAA